MIHYRYKINSCLGPDKLQSWVVLYCTPKSLNKKYSTHNYFLIYSPAGIQGGEIYQNNPHKKQWLEAALTLLRDPVLRWNAAEMGPVNLSANLRMHWKKKGRQQG